MSSSKKKKGKSPTQLTKKDKNRFENGKKVMISLFDKVRERQPKLDTISSVSDLKKVKSIKELYKDITSKSPIMKCYAEVMRCQMGRPPDKIYMKDFIQFCKVIAPEIYENNVKDLFYYLCRDSMKRGSPKESDEDKQVLSTEELGRRYDEYIVGEENLKGVLNMHTLKARNYELQQKITQWKLIKSKHKSLHTRYRKKVEVILSKLKELEGSRMINKEEIETYRNSFYDLLEKERRLQWEFKTIMKFLAGIPQTGIISLNDFKRYFDNINKQYSLKISLMRTFILQVRQRCSLDGQSFSFFDLPDLILYMNYNKNEYSLIIKYVNKLKQLFLGLKKAEGREEKVTDEDMVPFTLLDDTSAKIRLTRKEKQEYLARFLNNCENEVNIKKAKLNVTKERVMTTIENNTLIGHLNTYIEALYTDLNLSLYIVNRLFSWLSAKDYIFRVNEFLTKFKRIIALSKDDAEFVKYNGNKLDKFNQKKKGITDTKSEKTDTSGLTGKPPKMIEEVEEAISILNPVHELTKEKLEESFQLDKSINELGPRDDKSSQKSNEENEYFIANEGKAYDPKAKFGVLEHDYTEYEPHMTKYEAVLPSDHYIKAINRQTPMKGEQWFVRPHHLETLTRHPYSKWDDILNTKYYSFYEAKKAKKPLTGTKEDMRQMANDLIESLENQLAKLREQKTNPRPRVSSIMRGRSLAFKSRNDTNTIRKLETSINEAKR